MALMVTAGWPSVRAMPSTGVVASSTVATLPRVTGAAPANEDGAVAAEAAGGCETTSFLRSSAVRAVPTTCTGSVFPAWVVVPTGRSTWAPLSACCTDWAETPRSAIRAGSSVIATCRWAEPVTVTLASPLAPLRAGRMTSSASCVMRARSPSRAARL